MRRIHIALAVGNIDDSIADYLKRFGAEPTVVVKEKYAMWRTDQMNFSINQTPERAGQLRHLGFEGDQVTGFSAETDTNGILWELFSPEARDAKIIQIYGGS